MKDKKEKKNSLILSLENDKKLDEETKMEYISLANMFLENFDKYINYTSLDMNKEIPIGIDVWKDFLNYPVIRKYIQSFRDEQITKIADAGLMKGNKDAVSIKKVMQEAGPSINNSNIVLIRLPEKREYE